MAKRVLLVLALVAAGCSSGSDVPGLATSAPEIDDDAITPAQLRAFDALQSDTSLTWSWLRNDRLGTPLHLSAPRKGPAVLAKGADAAVTTTSFLARYKDLFKMRDPGAELRVARREVDALSMTHVRFQQIVRGIPVRGAELSAHYDADGHLASLDANYVPGLEDVDVEPAVDASEARDVVMADVLATMKGVTERDLSPSDGELIVFARNGEARLAYEVRVRAIVTNEPAIWVTTVDAKTGQILDRYNDLQTAEGAGTGVLGDKKKLQVSTSGGGYVLTDTSRGAPIRTLTSDGQQVTAEQGASPVTSDSLTTWDRDPNGPGAAVDAHFYAGVVYDYYKTTHARNGIDGKGGAMDSAAHFGQGYDNAFWDGQAMNYGDGGQYFKPLSAGLDVCAHEFTHGVTQVSSNLTYQGQSGALNESVSDIFGVMVEHFYKANEAKNWIMGEDIAKQGIGLRDFKDPKTGDQPDNMSRYVNTQQDNGGVHINSGIPNNAAYLMTMGGTNPTSKVNVAFGIGWDKAAKVWYRANTKYFMSNTNFAQAAQGTMQAAQDLALTENEQNIIDCAWKATGVVSGSCNTVTDPESKDPLPTTPGDGTGDGTGADDGTSADDGTGEGDSVGDGASTGPSRRPRVPLASSGCNVGATGDVDLGPFAGLLLAMVGLALGRRKKR